MITCAFASRWICGIAIGVIGVSIATVASPRAGLAAPAAHENPRSYCARAGTDDELHQPPPALEPAIRRLFNIRGNYALKTTYYRCAEGAVKICFVGANLPCGKANASRSLPAVTRWCETHPDTEFIPLYVTGHNSLYSWHCVGARAATGAPRGTLDAQGFFADYWKTAE